MIDILDLEEDGGVLGDGDAMTAHARLRSGIEGLSDEDLRLRLRELEVEARQLAAETALVVAAAERRMVHQIDGHRSAAAWLRAETNCSPGRATVSGSSLA